MQADLPLPAHVPLVVATRGQLVESVHYGSVAVADATGRLLWHAGDTDFPVFTRSTLKPFQALPFVADGGPARFGFSPVQVALLCASHSGEARQVAAVGDMLARAGCRPADLRCGWHLPIFFTARGITPPADLVPDPLQHNCSGKHAGFLAWCRLHGASLADYLEPVHPLQQAIRQGLARLAGAGEVELVPGVDGCGAPNYALPLARLARLYARLAQPDAAGADAPALATLSAAMRAQPEMVSGEFRDDLLLARAGPWLAKGGAEGVQALAVPERGIGIAIKIADGGTRALRVATAAVLAQLGLLPEKAGGALADWHSPEIRNHAGRITGRLQAVLELRQG